MKSSVTTRSKQETTGAHHGGFSKRDVNRFLKESNLLEQDDSLQGIEDAKEAWAFLADKNRMTPSIILCLHDIMMSRVYPKIAGNWRDTPVFVGDKLVDFVSQARIETDVKHLCNEIMGSIEKGVDNTKELHVAFEKLHPFTDGNGRVGRIIYNWHREKLGLPIHIIKADWPKQKGEQASYHSWFTI